LPGCRTPQRGSFCVSSGRKLARSCNIPISQPTKYEIALNLKTVKEIGIEIPPTLLVQADEVIE
jgi:putative ABC transport system substrate-binding protein